MGTKDIYFSDGYGVDFRNDDVHKISYISGSNALRVSTYSSFQLYTTVNTKTNMTVDYDGVRLAQAVFFRKNHAADNCYIVDDANGTMELHVPTGQKVKVVVG
jgi:hypothetical protein